MSPTTALVLAPLNVPSPFERPRNTEPLFTITRSSLKSPLTSLVTTCVPGSLMMPCSISVLLPPAELTALNERGVVAAPNATGIVVHGPLAPTPPTTAMSARPSPLKSPRSEMALPWPVYEGKLVSPVTAALRKVKLPFPAEMATGMVLALPLPSSAMSAFWSPFTSPRVRGTSSRHNTPHGIEMATAWADEPSRSSGDELQAAIATRRNGRHDGRRWRFMGSFPVLRRTDSEACAGRGAEGFRGDRGRRERSATGGPSQDTG
jgi:hypothetical protein